MTYKSVAIEAAKKAGKILKLEFKSLSCFKNKAKHDIVSDADYKSEKEIIKIINSAFPNHNITAEESGKNEKSSDYTWYIDPLDGTSNFIIGDPYFSVSIALSHAGKIILGVVYNPILNELYFAERGKGAFLNGKPIKVSDRSDIEDAILASAYSSDERDIVKGLKTIEKLSLSSRKVIVSFSPALNLCNIARGRIDGLIDNGTTPEDHAAGSLIVTEAGGKIQNYNSNSWDVNKTGIIASNKKLHMSILRII